MTYRNRALLDIAHSMPCQAKFPHQCTGYQGCEPAHSDSSTFGRGFSHKSPDWAWAAMCHVAHTEITARVNGTLEREVKFAEWLRAYVGTQNWLWENGKIQLARKAA